MLGTFGFTNFVEICLINAMSPFDAFPLLSQPHSDTHHHTTSSLSSPGGQSGRDVGIIECGAKLRGGCGNGDEKDKVHQYMRLCCCFSATIRT